MIGKAFGFIIGRWQLSLGILAAFVLCLGLSYCKGRSDGVALEKARWELAAAKAAKRAAKASDAASEARARDIIRNHELEKARTDAIAQNPNNPRRALNCERLRQAGFDAAAAGC